MDFINSAVDVAALPATEELHLQPVQPTYKKVLLAEWLIASIVLSAIAAVVIFTNSTLKNSWGWALIVAATVAVCCLYFLSIINSFPFLAYAVRDKDVVFQKGWLIRRIKICPFNRIQNCTVLSGPLERKYGLASLIIYTAGADGADMRIVGLLQPEADRLRSFILNKIHATADETP